MVILKLEEAMKILPPISSKTLEEILKKEGVSNVGDIWRSI